MIVYGLHQRDGRGNIYTASRMRDIPFRRNVALKEISFRKTLCVIETEFNLGLANGCICAQCQNREYEECRIGERHKSVSKRRSIASNLYL